MLYINGDADQPATCSWLKLAAAIVYNISIKFKYCLRNFKKVKIYRGFSINSTLILVVDTKFNYYRISKPYVASARFKSKYGYNHFKYQFISSVSLSSFHLACVGVATGYVIPRWGKCYSWN